MDGDAEKYCRGACDETKTKVDNYTTTDKSYKCVATCPVTPTKTYEDSLTFPITFCVPSCHALIPIAYIKTGGIACT